MKLRSLFAFTVAAACLFAGLSSRADTPTSYTWAQTYGVGSYDDQGNPTGDPFYGSGSDYPVDIGKMPDGGVVVAGRLDLPNLYLHSFNHTSANADSVLVRYAPDGSILWQRQLHQ